MICSRNAKISWVDSLKRRLLLLFKGVTGLSNEDGYTASYVLSIEATWDVIIAAEA